jgi:hypothetical protein
VSDDSLSDFERSFLDEIERERREAGPNGRAAGERHGRADEPSEKRDRKSAAATLVNLADESGAELWHDRDGDGYITFTVGNHRENHPVNSKSTRLWLSRLYYEKTGKVPAADATREALAILEGRARFDGDERSVSIRIAEANSAIYIDAGDTEWRALRVDATGWRVVTNLPAMFRRARGMRPLPLPTAGGIDLLRQFLNLSARGFLLIIGWLLAALRPRGPYPVLVLHGPHGSAKSTTARLVVALIDPNTLPLRAEPREPRDLMIAASNGWAVALDNVSRLSVWLSDAICRLSTGGGFSTRRLYTDAEEARFDVQRPVILNGIEAVATRSDLLDRALIIELEAIPEEKRRTEAELWTAFEEARPAILGALLAGVSAGLRNLESTRLERLPRLADWATWVTACEPGLDWKRGTILGAFTANRDDADGLALDAAPVAQYLLRLARQVTGGWRGTCGELLSACATMAAGDDNPTDRFVGDNAREKRETAIRQARDYLIRRGDGWPHSPEAMSGALKRLKPTLARTGLLVTFSGRQGHGGRRTVTITVTKSEVGKKLSHPSPPSPQPEERPQSLTVVSGSVNEMPAGDSGDGSIPSRADDTCIVCHAPAFCRDHAPDDSLSWLPLPAAVTR